MIGVIQAEDTIQTFLSGDELEVNRVIADTLPQVYENRTESLPAERTIIHMETDNEGLKSLLAAITLVTAMFTECTFNAMNIISEKEKGIEFINQILPMTTRSYVIQKILLDFIGETASTIITALTCMRIEPSATFYGIMDLFNRQSAKLWPALAALLAHAIFIHTSRHADTVGTNNQLIAANQGMI
jgi:hypothetical protein